MFSIGKRKVRSKMTGFVEVSQNEMMVVDGGNDLLAAVLFLTGGTGGIILGAAVFGTLGGAIVGGITFGALGYCIGNML